LRGGISFNDYCIINFELETIVVTKGIGLLCEGFEKKNVASSGPVAATHGRNGDEGPNENSMPHFLHHAVCSERDVPSYRRMEDAT
jgi:hypothetical protein